MASINAGSINPIKSWTWNDFENTLQDEISSLLKHYVVIKSTVMVKKIIKIAGLI